MSQSLRRDLELLATFDNDHTDAGNGVVKDFSGKQRHLQASGGPTFGQNSPVGEAVAFDGTDDQFDTGEVVTFPDEFTWSSIYKIDNDDSTLRVLASNFDTNGGLRLQHNNGDFIVLVKDGSGSNVVVSDTHTSGQFYHVTVRRVGDTLQLFRDGLLTDDNPLSTHNLANETLKIGPNQPTDTWDGAIGFFATWSRALSDAEIEELNRMTDRMVSRL